MSEDSEPIEISAEDLENAVVKIDENDLANVEPYSVPLPQKTRVEQEMIEIEEDVCAYCQAEIDFSEPIHRCPKCNTPYHADCWQTYRKCAQLGCR